MTDNGTVASILKRLLDGQAPNGTRPDELGDWRDTVQALYDAHAAGGTAAVRQSFNALASRNPGLIALIASGEEDHPGGVLAKSWKVRNLSDAYQERPPWQYVIDGLILMPSLNIVYGGPGSLKSMLLADLCSCVAAGKPWLDPLPGDRGQNLFAFTAPPLPVLWIDFDNGTRRTDERIDSIAKAHGLPVETPFHYVSMPRPWLDISDITFITGLSDLIKHLGAKLIVVDNLGLVTGDTEENSAAMAQVMGNLRWLCDDTGSAVIMVHHQRKTNGLASGVRKGESLRGHSSIEAAIDLALLVERKEGQDDIVIIPTKVRGYKQFDEIGGMFSYTHKDGTYDLESARFWQVEARSKERKDLDIISDTIFDILRSAGPTLTETLITGVRDDMASQPGGKAPGVNRVRGLIKRMVDHGELAQSVTSNKRYISLP